MRPMSLVRRIWAALSGVWYRGLRIVEVKGDAFPTTIEQGKLVRLVDDGEDWSVGMLCPCGCGETIEIMLLPCVSPRWDLKVDAQGRPTLYPSVWRSVGCKSHFWVKRGRVVWVPDH